MIFGQPVFVSEELCLVNIPPPYDRTIQDTLPYRVHGVSCRKTLGVN